MSTNTHAVDMFADEKELAVLIVNNEWRWNWLRVWRVRVALSKVAKRTGKSVWLVYATTGEFLRASAPPEKALDLYGRIKPKGR